MRLLYLFSLVNSLSQLQGNARTQKTHLTLKQPFRDSKEETLFDLTSDVLKE